jgi:hypothetical protein
MCTFHFYWTKKWRLPHSVSQHLQVPLQMTTISRYQKLTILAIIYMFADFLRKCLIKPFILFANSKTLKFYILDLEMLFLQKS